MHSHFVMRRLNFICCLKDQKKQAAERRVKEKEERKLREKLKQELAAQQKTLQENGLR